MRIQSKQAGATLIEAVVAIGVLGLALPPLSNLFAEVSAHTVDDTYQRMAVAYADAMMEEVVARHFEDPDLSEGSFGAEESTRTDYDDIDDYDGFAEASLRQLSGDALDAYGGFSRQVTVDNVTAADPDPSTPSADGSTAFKRIRVAVSWTTGKAGSFELATLRTRLVSSTSSGPLDTVASVAGATKLGSWRFFIPLVNTSGEDLVLDRFELSSDLPSDSLFIIYLEGAWLWFSGSGLTLPTGETAFSWWSAGNRTVATGTSPRLFFGFSPNPSGTVTYTVVVHFTNGESSTLTFPIAW